MEQLKQELHRIFISCSSSRTNVNLFDAFIEKCKEYYDQPVHSFSEMKRRDNKKLRGDIFEQFCVLYLLHVKKYQQVYLLSDCPDDILSYLNIPSRDMGIDIIVCDNDKYYAVQCKYRKHDSKKRNVISWKILSTFYALCLRSEHISKYIVMTNADCVSHQTKKTSKDLSICINSFRNITDNQWLLMCGIEGRKINDEKEKDDDEKEKDKEEKDIVKDKEDMRLKRLQYFNK